MRCQRCQQVLASDVQFCGNCGISTASHPSNASTQIHVQQVTNNDGDRQYTDVDMRRAKTRASVSSSIPSTN